MTARKQTNLDWTESQAAHVWHAAGYSPREIAVGMGVSVDTLQSEIYGRNKRTARILRELPCWAGRVPDPDGDKALTRVLDCHEAEAVVVWLRAGYSQTEIAEAMCMSQQQVWKYASRKTRAHQRLQERSAWAQESAR